MPFLLPFPALRYNLAHVSSLADVVAIVDRAADTGANVGENPAEFAGAGSRLLRSEVDRLYQRHPANVVRIIANRSEPGDESEDRFERAGEFVQQWLSEGLLTCDPSPAIYRYRQSFVTADGEVDRITGWIGLTPLETENDSPKSHDSGASSDSVGSRWIDAAGVFSVPAIGVCEKLPEDAWDRLRTRDADLASADGDLALATDDDGNTHELLRLADPQTCDRVAKIRCDCPLTFPDDGSVREVAREYPNRLAGLHGTLPASHPANFLLTLLVDEESYERYRGATHRRLNRLAGLLFYAVERLPS